MTATGCESIANAAASQQLLQQQHATLQGHLQQVVGPKPCTELQVPSHQLPETIYKQQQLCML
jgi:hypothetical protein